MDFTPEVEYEVISEAVSQTLYITLVNLSNKVWRDSTQTKTPTSPFQIDDHIRYTNEGQNEMVGLVYINTIDSDITKDIITIFRGNTMIVTKEFPKSINVPYIGSIPIYSENYINKSDNLTQEKIDNIMFP